MRPARLLAAPALLTASLALAACGSSDSPATTGDPGSGGDATSTSTDASSSTSTAGGSPGSGGAGGAPGAGGAGDGGTGGAQESGSGTGGSSASTTGVGGSSASQSSSSGASSSSSGSGGSEPGCDLDHLVVSEVRSRGPKGGNDDFIEIHNPTSESVTLDATWKVKARSTSAQKYTDAFTGSGEVLAAGGYFLIANKDAFYAGPKGDAKMDIGINDAGSIVIERGGVTVDAVCYYFNAGNKATVQGPGYTCEGEPVDNSVHASSSTGNVDASFEREACTDSGDNAADFVAIAPSTGHGAP